MAHRDPISRQDTHEVTNQPPPLEDFNRFTTDQALIASLRGAGRKDHSERLSRFGERTGSAEVIDLGIEANRNPPVLETYDRYGHRIDEVRFHPAYHQLMALGLDNGIAAIAWNGTKDGHTLHAVLTYLLGQVDAGPICPMTMTYAAVPALKTEPGLADDWVPRITASRYDKTFAPPHQKQGVTIGMAMTEKQGGSDVRANETRAQNTGDDSYRLTGHKWFCSAPMSDAFLTLAYTGEGLTCFLVPRWLPDGTRNEGFRIMRLKDKLGDRSNASSEIEYHGAAAFRLGEEGRGIASIMQMVQHTRLDCVIGSAATMRAALCEALWHTSHRTAFQKRLVDQPLMQSVLADLAVESEAATALAFRLAEAFDRDEALTRSLTPIAKYWVCKRASGLVNEAMECLGGAGYVETGPMPRLFRQSPLNAIWEGSGNVIALDVGRMLVKEPEAMHALDSFLKNASGRNAAYDRALRGLDLSGAREETMRHLVERLALLSQAAILLNLESPLADAFCLMRLESSSLLYGAPAGGFDPRPIIARAMPTGG